MRSMKTRDQRISPVIWFIAVKDGFLLIFQWRGSQSQSRHNHTLVDFFDRESAGCPMAETAPHSQNQTDVSLWLPVREPRWNKRLTSHRWKEDCAWLGFLNCRKVIGGYCGSSGTSQMLISKSVIQPRSEAQPTASATISFETDLMFIQRQESSSRSKYHVSRCWDSMKNKEYHAS